MNKDADKSLPHLSTGPASGFDPNWVYAGEFQRGFYGTKVDSDGD